MHTLVVIFLQTTAVPRKPAAKYVDTVSGDTFDLVASGLVPKYTNKKVIAMGPKVM